MNKKILIFGVILILFSGCGRSYKIAYNNSKPSVYSQNKNAYSNSMDKKMYSHSKMRSYVVHGVRYYPISVNVGDRFSGNASWYGPNFHGKLTSNGERYNMYDMTAAHKTLPMNTIVKVTNRRNGLSTVVRINDRGPFVATRIIDLSKSAASKINMIGTGTAPVTIEVLGFYSKNKKNKNYTPTNNKPYKVSKTHYRGKFALQIASFSRINGAISTQEKYDKIGGYKTIIKDTETNNGRTFKVLLTGFESEDEARDYKNRSAFSGAFIVRDN